MSYMCLGVAIRAIQKKDIEVVYEIAQKVYGRTADEESQKYKGGLSYFSYEEKKHNIKVYNVEGALCLDYMIKDKTDVDFVNESISMKEFQSVKRWLKKVGFDVDDLSYKVIYYHNGGCAGLCEVR